jgi:hypothetical protein
MSEPGSVMVAFGSDENLSFMHKPAKSFGIENPVSVPLEIGTDIAGVFKTLPSGICRTETVSVQVFVLKLFIVNP